MLPSPKDLLLPINRFPFIIKYFRRELFNLCNLKRYIHIRSTPHRLLQPHSLKSVAFVCCFVLNIQHGTPHWALNTQVFIPLNAYIPFRPKMKTTVDTLALYYLSLSVSFSLCLSHHANITTFLWNTLSAKVLYHCKSFSHDSRLTHATCKSNVRIFNKFISLFRFG